MIEATLSVAGLYPDPAEIDRLVRGRPRLAAGIEFLHNLKGVRYKEPALVFDPLPRFEAWD